MVEVCEGLEGGYAGRTSEDVGVGGVRRCDPEGEDVWAGFGVKEPDVCDWVWEVDVEEAGGDVAFCGEVAWADELRSREKKPIACL